jgi:chromosome segregation ATPase
LEAISTIPSTSSSSSQAKLDASGSAFPKIDSQVQKRRDQDRMQILLDEVRTEEGKLAELKKEFQNGEPERQGGERNYAKYQERVAMMKEEMQRAEKNIEALRREISQLK